MPEQHKLKDKFNISCKSCGGENVSLGLYQSDDFKSSDELVIIVECKDCHVEIEVCV